MANPVLKSWQHIRELKTAAKDTISPPENSRFPRNSYLVLEMNSCPSCRSEASSSKPALTAFWVSCGSVTSFRETTAMTRIPKKTAKVI